MRIAFFVHRFPVVSEAFIANAAAGLIDAGHEVDIYALDGPGGRAQGLAADYDLAARCRVFRLRESPRRRLALAPLAGVKLAVVHGAGAVRGAFGDEGADLIALHEAALFRRGGRYDILHCQFGTLAETVLNHRRAGFLSGRVFVHFRGYDISGHVREQGEDVYRRVFAEADGFFAVCGAMRDRAIELGAPAERTTLVPSGVAVKDFGYKSRSWSANSTLNLLAVGRFVEKKGFKYAIDAVGRLAAAGLDPRLLIMGDGPLGETLRAQVAALGLGDRVSFFGAATQEQIAAELDRAHIFLAPSTTAANGDREGVINTLKEAMAAGCPFVTTDHGGIPELVDGLDAGIMTPEADSKAIAEAVVALLERRADWPHMGRRGRRRVIERYSNAAVAQQTVAAYQRAFVAPNAEPIGRIALHAV